MAKTPRKAQSLVSVKVTLRGIRPPIWRRLVLPGSLTLGDLHQAIQVAMGWEGYHLHAFAVDGRHYGDPHSVDDVLSEERLTLSALRTSGISRFSYTYDFGDGWEHAILIEKRQPPADGRPTPACVAGKRACPPEDCGGIWGYHNLVEVLADPEHPNHDEWLEMYGEDFDPEDFSVEDADASVAARFRRQ